MSEPTTPKRPTLIDPYAKCTDTNTVWRRLNVDLPETDFLSIASIAPSRGTISITCRVLWNRLRTALNNQNITTYADTERFITFLNHAVLVDGRTFSGIASQTPEPDVRSGVKGLRNTDTSSPHSKSDLPSTGEQKRKRPVSGKGQGKKST